MHPFPHVYSVATLARPDGDITLESDRLPPLRTSTPVEFDGPGDRWSPETLLVAAVGDCFALTFRGIARASKLRWTSLTCQVWGTLDRVQNASQFTDFLIRARIQVPDGTNADQARRLLQKVEETCLITRSLSGTTRLEATVELEGAALPVTG
jgi:organic hydroperoxide reductase OsmC/OhrA